MYPKDSGKCQQPRLTSNYEGRLKLDLEQATQITYTSVSRVVDDTRPLHAEMRLIGGEALLDSTKLVELCLELEEEAEKLGFEFDWTSSVALSKSQSMFRTIGSLAEEFLNQSRK